MGKLFYHCLNVIYPEHGSKKGKLLKLLVEVEFDKPLLRGTKIKLGEEVLWVDFAYEMMPTFCLYCGMIGHTEKSCERKMSDAKENMISEGQYGE